MRVSIQWGATPHIKLEAPIPAFSAAKEGDVASLPSPLVNTSRLANRFLLAVGKVLPFASPLLHRVAMSASSDELEASITSFSTTKEGDVASRPLRLQIIKDRQIGVLFAVGKVLPFACPLHL